MPGEPQPVSLDSQMTLRFEERYRLGELPHDIHAELLLKVASADAAQFELQDQLANQLSSAVGVRARYSGSRPSRSRAT